MLMSAAPPPVLLALYATTGQAGVSPNVGTEGPRRCAGVKTKAQGCDALVKLAAVKEMSEPTALRRRSC